MKSGHATINKKPTALIDKSFFEEICSCPEDEQDKLWRVLHDRYRIIIPFILVEEVWVNLLNPMNKDPQVIWNMVKTLAVMRNWWLDDEYEIAFHELVLGEKVEFLRSCPPEFIDFMLNIAAGPLFRDLDWVTLKGRLYFAKWIQTQAPELPDWLQKRTCLRKQIIQDRIRKQNSIIAKNKFEILNDEMELFTHYISHQITGALKNPERKQMLLEQELGCRFRSRHEEKDLEINKAFQNFTIDSFHNFPVSVHCIITSMFYFYAPLVRIRNAGPETEEIIIGRRGAEQRNNQEDQKYVVSALMCKRLLTLDAGMHRLMNLFKVSPFWTGESILFKKNHIVPLSNQVPAFLH